MKFSLKKKTTLLVVSIAEYVIAGLCIWQCEAGEGPADTGSNKGADPGTADGRSGTGVN